jgi:hypothetical protein
MLSTLLIIWFRFIVAAGCAPRQDQHTDRDRAIGDVESGPGSNRDEIDDGVKA